MGGDWGDEEDEGRKPHYPLTHAHAQITKNRQPLIQRLSANIVFPINDSARVQL